MSIPFFTTRLVNGKRENVEIEVYSTNIGFEAEVRGDTEKIIHRISGPEQEELPLFLGRIEKVCNTFTIERER